ncbi:hypothetical protein [Actinoplanes sp. N902-109]|uniref:hypothetical protein n=1 Tax=Actinoplanes sp. (strain N902-109) TaxID=649831 RepID=UPI00032966B9|nr:hypothetical protein [Actinoplanes sp. N902-109]AGL19647.1 hypothetical protein L083_6137 [Actinoplanes sp. N902-109]
MQLAWLPASFGLGLLAMAPTGSVLLRHGHRPALVAGSLALAAPALAASAVLLAVAASVPLAIAGALLLGIGGAAVVLVTPVMLAGAGAAVQLTRVTAASSLAVVLAPAAIGALDANEIASGRLALLVCVPPMLLLAGTARPGPAEATAMLA